MLRSNTVDADKRMGWLDERLKMGLDALICHPQLVETGVDMLDFPTIVWLEADYNTARVRQASRRSCRVGDVEIVTSLIAGNFPDYDRLIPQRYKTRVALSSDEFLRATRTAAIFARDDSNVIRLRMAGGEDDAPGCLAVSARAVEVGDNQGRLGVAVEGDDGRIAINSKYLIDVLEAIGGDMAIEITSATSPGVLKPVGSDDYVHVVMPMFAHEWGPKSSVSRFGRMPTLQKRVVLDKGVNYSPRRRSIDGGFAIVWESRICDGDLLRRASRRCGAGWRRFYPHTKQLKWRTEL